MRILQLIDSLEAGGAERMAVNYANLLSQKGFDSYLVSTRREGILKDFLLEKVNYLFLEKRSTFDFIALKKLRKFITCNSIEIIHAHGDSWFLAVLCRWVKKDFKILWHDHYGNSGFLNKRPKQPLKFFSNNFCGIICVNEHLWNWSHTNLNCRNIKVIKNFISNTPVTKKEKNSTLQLVCLANFREQKDHITLFKSCDRASKKINFHLHLIGKEFQNPYSMLLLSEIDKRPYITYHGEINPQNILKNMDVGILTSRSEGLPLAILEYGAAKLAVISSNVGAVGSIIGESGILTSPGNCKEICEAIVKLGSNSELRDKKALDLQNKIFNEYSKEKIFDSYISFIKEAC